MKKKMNVTAACAPCNDAIYAEMSDLVDGESMSIRKAAEKIADANDFTPGQIRTRYQRMKDKEKVARPCHSDDAITETQSCFSEKANLPDIDSQEKTGDFEPNNEAGSVFDAPEPEQEQMEETESVFGSVPVPVPEPTGINLKSSDRLEVDKKIRKYLNRMKAGVADAVRGQKDLMIIVGKAGAEENQGEVIRQLPEWGQLCKKMKVLGDKVKELNEI